MPSKSPRQSKNKTAVEAKPEAAPSQPIGLPAGVVLAFAGQLVLLQTVSGSPEMGARQLVAGILLIVGALVFGSAALRRPLPAAPLDFPIQPDEPPDPAWYEPKWGLAAAGILTLASVVIFRATGETP